MQKCIIIIDLKLLCQYGMKWKNNLFTFSQTKIASATIWYYNYDHIQQVTWFVNQWNTKGYYITLIIVIKYNILISKKINNIVTYRFSWHVQFKFLIIISGIAFSRNSLSRSMEPLRLWGEMICWASTIAYIYYTWLFIIIIIFHRLQFCCDAAWWPRLTWHNSCTVPGTTQEPGTVLKVCGQAFSVDIS